MTKSSVQLLRDGDPAAGVDIEAIRPSFDLIAESASRAMGPGGALSRSKLSQPKVSQTGAGWTPGRRHRRRVLLLVSAVAATAFAAIAVGWPGTVTGSDSIAYGVTARPDGTVDFNLSPVLSYDPRLLQAQLQSAGIRAAVLAQSPAGQCNQPLPANVSSSRVITFPKDRQGGIVAIFHPRALHADETILISLPFRGEIGQFPSPAMVSMSVIREKPPICIPQSIFPANPGSPSIGAVSSVSPAMPTSVPSPVPTDGLRCNLRRPAGWCC